MTAKIITNDVYASTGYVLDGGRYSSLTVTATGVVGGRAGGGHGVYGVPGGAGVKLGFTAQITNAGEITGGAGYRGGSQRYGQLPLVAGGMGGAGLRLAAGGVLVNSGGITGGAGGAGGPAEQNAGPSEGGAGGFGVWSGAGGWILNRATISGGAGGIGGADQYYSGVPAGTGGEGGDGIFFAAYGKIHNAGLIAGGAGGIGNDFRGHGAGGVGVYLAGGGAVFNSGTVRGGYGDGVGAGVWIVGRGSVVNGQGTIVGAVGVSISGGGTVTNGKGLISGAAGSGNDGVRLGGGGIVTNASGTIIGGGGGSGVSLSGGGDVTNGTGLIAGGSVGGVGVRLAGGGDVHNRGTIAGGGGARGADGSYYYIGNGQGGFYENPPGVGGIGGAGVLLTLPGTVQNSGSIIAGAGGAGGSTATYESQGYAAAGGGQGGVGVQLAGGAVRNSALIAGGAGGAGGNGYYSAGGAGAGGGDGALLTALGAVANQGRIVGGAGGAGGTGDHRAAGAGGAGGAGVRLVQGGSVFNQGAILGAAGGAGGAGKSGDGGVGGSGGQGVLLERIGAVVNTGTIKGGARGLGGAAVGGQHGANGVTGAGAELRQGGFVINGSSSVSTAVISGGIGVYGAGALTVTNFGTIAGTSGVAVKFRSANDRLIAESGSTFTGEVLGGGGTLELANGTGTITGLGGAAQLSGTEAIDFQGFASEVIDAAASWTLAGVNRLGLGQSIKSVGALTVTGTLTGAGALLLNGGSARIAGATLGIAETVIQSAATVVLAGSICNRGTVTTHTDHLLIDAAGAALAGGGQLSLLGGPTAGISGQSPGATLTNVDNLIQGGGQIGAGQLVLANGAAGRIVGDAKDALLIDTGASTIQNAGLISASAGGGVEIKSAVANTGWLAAWGGTLTLDKTVTGAGSARIGAGGLLFAADAFSQNVEFLGTGGGMLELASSRTYAGKILGFSGADSLDLRDIGFISASEATFSGGKASGTLTVTDGTRTATIKLAGDHTGVTFIAASDGHGGTNVTEHATPSAVQNLIAALAATPGNSDRSTLPNHPLPPAAATWVLAHPRSAPH